MDEINNINKTKLLIIGGHSEYWTMKARNNLESIIINGTNILSLSGNTLWWCVDYADNNTKMVCIREKQKIELLKENIKIQKDFSNTMEFCSIENNYQKLSPFYILGVDYLIGGYGKCNSSEILPYYNIVMDKNNVLLRELHNDKIHLGYEEFDGIYTNIKHINEVNSNFDVCNIMEIEDINSVLNKLELHKQSYSIFKYKKLIMCGTIENPSASGIIKRFSGIIAVKKNDTSGIILNMCCMDWCHSICFDSDVSGKDIKILTKNSIDILLGDSNKIFD